MSQPTELAIRHEDVEAALSRLREFSDRVQQLTDQAERDSMAAAADMTLVYEAREWVEDLPPAKTHRFGRPVLTDTPTRFAQWVALNPDRVGSVYSASTGRVQQMLQAHWIASEYLVGIQISSDSALRPLRTFRTQRSEELPDIARRIKQISEGKPVTGVIVRRAVHDHNQAVRPPQNHARGSRRTPEMEIRDQFRRILAAGRLRDASRLLIELRDELLAAQHDHS